jgi:hypothetical protein
LASLPIPKYFYLAIKGTMRIDWERSGLHEPCSVCGAPVKAQIKSPDRIYLVEDTWDGSDLFRGRPYGGPYCTLRVLLLAREERWTNFRFYPIDESHEVQVYSEGIDYLGDQWPPTWCADRPSAGKALNEWLDDFFSLGETPEDYKRYMAAMRALDDLGAEALPPLIERFNAGSLKAANGILSIAQRGTTVSPDLLDRAEQAVWAEDSKHNPHLFEKDENGKLRYRDLS